jgi:hypothetical protein
MADKDLEEQVKGLEARFNVFESEARMAKAAPGGGSTVSTSCCTHSCPCVV